MTELEDDARAVRTRITLRDHDQLRRTLARIDEQGGTDRRAAACWRSSART